MAKPVHNFGYYARGFFWCNGELKVIDSSPLFPSTLSLVEIADRAQAWALATPGVDAYKLMRRMPGEYTGRPVGCMMVLKQQEVSNG